MSDTADKIQSEAQKPKSVSTDGVVTTRRSIADQIMADKYKRAVDAQEAGAAGPVFQQIVAPGGPQ